VTFIVSPEGRIEEIIQHERQVWRHLDDVITALERRVDAPATV
jgi:peroxiredoxin Q/BCP